MNNVQNQGKGKNKNKGKGNAKGEKMMQGKVMVRPKRKE